MSRIKTCPFTLIWILFLLLINHYTDVIHCTTSKKLFGHANLQGDYNILNEDENDLSPAFLYTKVLTADDLIEVLDELNNYVSRYDHQIVCGDLQAKDEVCKMAINQLALNYYQNALNTTQHGWRSYVWRQSHNNQLYGVMLILDPKQRGNGQNNHHNQMNKVSQLNNFDMVVFSPPLEIPFSGTLNFKPVKVSLGDAANFDINLPSLLTSLPRVSK
ncbi:unnamed protein product [Trichobilharzia regenti]|nr:unnamed protein product [Trichobilharzia regenti]